MGAYIFNILSVLRMAKDTLVSAGPQTAYTIAEAMERVAEGARMFGRFIEQYGGMIQFSPGGGPPALDADSQQWVGELEKLHREVASALQVEGAQPAQAQRTPGGQRTKADLLQEVSDLTTKVLDAVGRGEPPQAREAQAAREAAHEPEPAQQRARRTAQAQPAQQKSDESRPPGPAEVRQG